MVNMKKRTGLPKEQSDEYGTPDYIFKPFDSEFRFEIDVAATDENRKAHYCYTKERSGLLDISPWDQPFWCNPPYSDQLPWCQKGYEQSQRHNVEGVILGKYDPSTAHGEFLGEYADELRIFTHRIKFVGASNGANFPVVAAVFRKRLFTRKTEPRILTVNFRKDNPYYEGHKRIKAGK